MNNARQIPYLGLGTYKMRPGDETRNCVQFALEIGYRHIDTAALYANEQDVGYAIKYSGIPRENIFVTTKLWNSEHGYDKAIKAFHRSLSKLGLDYVDLYLIHWPLENKRNDSYKALETLYSEGLCRSIGVSNYTIKHIEELLKLTDITPQVNQVEMSPYLYQKDLIEYCQSKHIAVQAYSPLLRGKKAHDKRLLSIAEKYYKSWAQILIRWALQLDMIVLPKSSNFKRIQENANVFDFEISSEDMELLNSFHENFRIAWDPTNII